MDKIIQAFFQEGISRITPGLVVIGFYFSCEVEEVFRESDDQNFIIAACTLLTAWLIGFLIESGLFNLWRIACILWSWRRLKLPLDIFKKKYPKISKKIDFCTKCSISDERVHAERDYLHFWAVKDNAEGIMSRGLSFIFFITLIWPPNGFIEEQWNKHIWFKSHFFNWWSLIGLVGFGMYFFFHFYLSRKDSGLNKKLHD